ncbi:MAG: N-acetyltransferase [Pseudomonadota bacterium]
MTPNDMAALHALCFKTPRPWTEHEIEKLISSKGVQVSSSPLGFAITRDVAGEAELLTIAVHPGHRRSGIASALLHQAIANLSAEILFLEVASDNLGAHAFYEKNGFNLIGTRKAYYRRTDGSRLDARLYSKLL